MPESVWDYPRPPRVEPSGRRVRVVLGGAVIAEHDPGAPCPGDEPPAGVLRAARGRRPGALEPSSRSCHASASGRASASYFDVIGGDGRRVERAAWTYLDPAPAFETIRDAVAFYPGLMDECTLDGELVEAQPGGFYGGWITSEVVGRSRAAPARGSW